MKKRTVTLIIGMVVVAWLGCFALVPILSRIFSTTQLSAMGATGDMFGAANSLFAGLGAAGVIVVLMSDLRERRKDLRHRQEEFRPFVTAEFKSGKIDEAFWRDDFFRVDVSVEILIKNEAASPALNIDLSSSIELEKHTAGEVKLSNAPLGASRETSADRVARVKFSRSGNDAVALVRALRGNDSSLRVPVQIDYTSINGVAWSSIVHFSVACERPADHALLRKVELNEENETIGRPDGQLGGGNVVILSAEPITGTWEQKRAD